MSKKTIKDDKSLTDMVLSEKFDLTIGLENDLDLEIFTKDKIKELSIRMMPLIVQMNNFGKSQTQEMDKWNVMRESPTNAMGNCLAQIEKKRNALGENIFKLRKKRNDVEKIKLKLEGLKLRDNLTPRDKLNMERMRIELEEASYHFGTAKIYIDGCLKGISTYVSLYEKIAKDNDLDNFDEKDLERQELEHHTKTAIKQAFQSFTSNGLISQGNTEYLLQQGLNPSRVLGQFVKWRDGDVDHEETIKARVQVEAENLKVRDGILQRVENKKLMRRIEEDPEQEKNPAIIKEVEIINKEILSKTKDKNVVFVFKEEPHKNDIGVESIYELFDKIYEENLSNGSYQSVALRYGFDTLPFDDALRLNKDRDQLRLAEAEERAKKEDNKLLDGMLEERTEQIVGGRGIILQ